MTSSSKVIEDRTLDFQVVLMQFILQAGFCHFSIHAAGSELDHTSLKRGLLLWIATAKTGKTLFEI